MATQKLAKTDCYIILKSDTKVLEKRMVVAYAFAKRNLLQDQHPLLIIETGITSYSNVTKIGRTELQVC